MCEPRRFLYNRAQDRLLEWGRGLGLTFPDMIIRKGPVGRGLFVKKKAKAGKTLYEVPETMWFSIPTIRNFSAFSSFVDDADFIRHSNQALAPDKVSACPMFPSRHLLFCIVLVASSVAIPRETGVRSHSSVGRPLQALCSRGALTMSRHVLER
jgi:hypothetical protein